VVRRSRAGSLMALGLCLALLAGCGGRTPPRAARSGSVRAALERYVAQVEPIRLSVNRLLEGADPILSAFREHRTSPARAAARMGALELQFANSTVDIAAIEPSLPVLRSLQAEYAGTYVLEDAYLSALVSGLARNDLHDLPDTQAAQRAAIIRWRTGLMVLARRARAPLPADLQQAGRGEIAPSPLAS
jgi:hypothetical protein